MRGTLEGSCALINDVEADLVVVVVTIRPLKMY